MFAIPLIAAAGTAVGGSTIAATAMAVAASAAAANQQRQSSNMAADAALQNAKIASDQGYAREALSRRQSAGALGRMTAAFGESGADTTSGSNLDVTTGAATNAELDALDVRANGLIQSFGFQRDAAFDRTRATQATASGYWGAGNAILSGVNRYYGLTRGAQPPIDQSGLYVGMG